MRPVLVTQDTLLLYLGQVTFGSVYSISLIMELNSWLLRDTWTRALAIAVAFPLIPILFLVVPKITREITSLRKISRAEAEGPKACIDNSDCIMGWCQPCREEACKGEVPGRCAIVERPLGLSEQLEAGKIAWIWSCT